MLHDPGVAAEGCEMTRRFGRVVVIAIWCHGIVDAIKGSRRHGAGTHRVPRFHDAAAIIGLERLDLRRSDVAGAHNNSRPYGHDGTDARLVPYTVWSFGEMGRDFRAKFRAAAQAWDAQEAYIWSMEAIDVLLHHHPEWKNIWERLPRKIMKSDIARYLVAYEYGGMYTDYDVQASGVVPKDRSWDVCLQVEKTLEKWQVSPRSTTHREKHYLQRIAQYFFAVKPKHEFFRLVLDESRRRIEALFAENHKRWDLDKWVLYATGPDVVTTVYHEHFENNTRVLLMPQGSIAKHMSLGRWKEGQDGGVIVADAPPPSAGADAVIESEHTLAFPDRAGARPAVDASEAVDAIPAADTPQEAAVVDDKEQLA